MIYEIDGKIYIKMENYYSQVELKYGRLIPVKNRKKLYFSEVDARKVKQYSIEEYQKKEYTKKATKEY